MPDVEKPSFIELRKRAEKILTERERKSSGPGETDLLRLIHELDIYQVALDLQNEELRQAKDDLDVSRNQYKELYDSAPAGFVTLDSKKLVTRVNRAAESMLAAPGHTIIRTAFSSRIHPQDHDLYFSCLRKVADSGDRHKCDVRLFGKGGNLVYARIEAGADFDEAKNVTEWRLSLSDIIKQKETEEELHESELRYRTLFNSIDEGFCIIEMIFDENGRPIDYRFLETNPSFEKQTGLIGAQGKTIRELVPKHEEHWFETYGQVALTGQPARFQNLAEQLHRWYDVYAFRCGRPENRQVAVLFKDITGRKRAQEKLVKALAEAREQRRIFEAMMEYIPMGITIVDAPDMKIRAVSRYGRELMGKPRQQIEGILLNQDADLWQVYHADGITPSRVESLPLRRAVKQGELVEQEEWVIARHDGKKIPILSTAAPIRDSKGNITGGVIGWQDISERKRSEEELRESAHKFRMLAENPIIGVFIFQENKFVYLNERLAEMHGYRPEEVIGQPFYFLIAPEARDHIIEREQFRQSAEDPLIEWLETLRVRKNEERFWAEVILSEIIYQGRRAVMGFVLDISERKKAEEAMHRYQDELELRVEERTAELKERAEQLARLSSQLTLTEHRERRRLAEILHDHLQQFLIAAKINIEVLSASIGAEHRKMVENILNLMAQSIETSRSLTSELSPPVLRQGSLSAALEWLVRWMHEKHGLTVELQADPGLDPEQEDVAMLTFQSIRELLLNVVKHAGVKSARVEMSREETNRLCVTVSDEGCGFDPAGLRERAQDGSGFGLFTIRERLMLLGGNLEIESSPGRGAFFSLIIPSEIKRSHKKGVQETFPGFIPTKTPAYKRRLLLADDHTVVRQGLSTMLSRHPDIEIVGEAADGKAAVRMARKLKPDVILMDVSMPKMDGVEATRIIHSELPHIRIIGLSMHDREDQAVAMIEAGASAYCTKDGAADMLLSAIREGAGPFL